MGDDEKRGWGDEESGGRSLVGGFKGVEEIGEVESEYILYTSKPRSRKDGSP